jgi:hypothetical protein
LIGVNRYVFDDDTSIKSGFKFVKLFGVPLFTTFCHFLSHRGTQKYQNPNLWLPYLAGCRFLCF